MSYIDYVEQLNLLCTAKISVNTENVCFAGKPKERIEKAGSGRVFYNN
jgi:hypothetical protein